MMTCNTAAAVQPAAPATDGLADADFARLSDLIAERTGIKLTPSKRMTIERGLRKRASSLGIRSVDEYCRHVFDRGGLQAELETLVHMSTTNKTDFFREIAHFDEFAGTLLPRLLGDRHDRRGRRLKVWSAAASNGAEAFTAAIVLAEAAARGPRFEFAVLGTDISSDMVAAASRAVYPAAMIDSVAPELRQRYFMRARSSAPVPTVRVVPELRRRVAFCQLNLVDQTYPVDRDVDVIFLRNVLIYFAAATQEAVLRRLVGHIRPGGYLILGHTEAAIGNALGLEQVATGIFHVE